MGKKKRGHPDVEEILSRPWCYYCERDFDDLKILINHQKAKHFKCERCGRRLNTAGGLSVHMTQVHKETLTIIENALPNRSNLDVEIFGMEGIPDDVVSSHNQRVLSQFAQAEAERRAATGNPGPGGAASSAAKKPKIEDPADLKKRLAEHKAKKAAEQAAGISSGDATPIDGGHGSPSPAFGQNPGFAGSPPFPQQQMPYGGPANGSTYSSYPQPYGQPGMPFQQPQQFTQHSPGFGSPPVAQYSTQQVFPPQQQFPPSGNQSFMPPQFHHNPQPQFPGGPPRPFGAGSPPVPFHQQSQYQPPRTQTPPQPVSAPQRAGSLQSAPGLPQRPSFGAPPVNAFQMQQMHQGQIPGPPNPVPVGPYSHNNQHGSPQNSGPGSDASQTGLNSQQVSHAQTGNGNVVLANQSQGTQEAQDKSSTFAVPLSAQVSSVVDNPTKDVPSSEPPAETKSGDNRGEKKSKKEKEKDTKTKMVYSDNETSPEEKMAQLSRYAFVPDRKGETVLGDATTAAVTGVARGYDDPYDTNV